MNIYSFRLVYSFVFYFGLFTTRELLRLVVAEVGAVELLICRAPEFDRLSHALAPDGLGIVYFIYSLSVLRVTRVLNRRIAPLACGRQCQRLRWDW